MPNDPSNDAAPTKAERPVATPQPSEPEPRWRTIERTIAVLEKMLQPGARVSHNVLLKELITGTRRQCDVVVRSGAAPRETITIVEVQDRNRRVELSDYEGWCQKREKVGAQHLICVSVTGFPESVQRDAALKGDTVRLMTLLDPSVFPSFFAARAVTYDLEVVEAYDMEVVFDTLVPNGQATGRIDEKKFVVSNSERRLSLADIAEAERSGDRVLNMTTTTSEDGFDRIYKLDFALPGRTFSIVADGSSYPIVELRVIEHCKRYHYQVALEPLAYEQIGFGSSLGWVFWGTGEHDAEQFTVRVPVVRLPNGQVRVGAVETSTPKGHTMIASDSQIVYSNSQSTSSPRKGAR